MCFGSYALGKQHEGAIQDRRRCAWNRKTSEVEKSQRISQDQGPSKCVRLAHYETCFKKLKAWGWEENPVCKLLPTWAQGTQFDPQSPHEKARCDVGYTPAISAQGGEHRQDLELPGQLPEPTEKTSGQWGAESETGCWCRYVCTLPHYTQTI